MKPKNSLLTGALLGSIASLGAMPKSGGSTMREAREHYAGIFDCLASAPRALQSTIDKPHATPTRTDAQQAEYERQMAALKVTRPELNSKGRKKLARAILRSK